MFALLGRREKQKNELSEPVIMVVVREGPSTGTVVVEKHSYCQTATQRERTEAIKTLIYKSISKLLSFSLRLQMSLMSQI